MPPNRVGDALGAHHRQSRDVHRRRRNALQHVDEDATPHRDVGHVARRHETPRNLVEQAHDRAATGRAGVLAVGAVDGDAFAEDVVVADLKAGDAAFPFQVLGFETEGGEGKNFVAVAELGVAVNDHVRMQFALVAEGDVLADDAVGSDLAAVAEFGAGMNDGGGMNHVTA